MNPFTRISATLLWSVVLGSGLCTLAPRAVGADESQLALPARRSAARFEEDGLNDDGPSEASGGGRRQVFGVDTRRPHHPLRIVTSSLAIVLGGFALFLVWFRRQTAAVSSGVMDSLGTIQVTPKVQLHLVRFGSRLLLLHVTPDKVQRVAEVTDPSEVQSLLAAHHGVTRQPVSDRVDELLQDFDAAKTEFAGTAGSSQR